MSRKLCLVAVEDWSEAHRSAEALRQASEGRGERRLVEQIPLREVLLQVKGRSSQRWSKLPQVLLWETMRFWAMSDKQSFKECAGP